MFIITKVSLHDSGWLCLTYKWSLNTEWTSTVLLFKHTLSIHCFTSLFNLFSRGYEKLKKWSASFLLLFWDAAVLGWTRNLQYVTQLPVFEDTPWTKDGFVCMKWFDLLLLVFNVFFVSEQEQELNADIPCTRWRPGTCSRLAPALCQRFLILHAKILQANIWWYHGFMISQVPWNPWYHRYYISNIYPDDLIIPVIS